MLYYMRFWVHYISYIASSKPLISFWRVVRVVDRAALEMLCPLPDPGFESRTLRHRRHKLCIACDVFFKYPFVQFCAIYFLFTPLPTAIIKFSSHICFATVYALVLLTPSNFIISASVICPFWEMKSRICSFCGVK